MENFYSSNDDFKDYVDKYCKQYGLTKEEAFNQELVIQVYLYYKKKEAET